MKFDCWLLSILSILDLQLSIFVGFNPLKFQQSAPLLTRPAIRVRFRVRIKVLSLLEMANLHITCKICVSPSPTFLALPNVGFLSSKQTQFYLYSEEFIFDFRWICSSHVFWEVSKSFDNVHFLKTPIKSYTGRQVNFFSYLLTFQRRTFSGRNEISKTCETQWRNYRGGRGAVAPTHDTSMVTCRKIVVLCRKFGC